MAEEVEMEYCVLNIAATPHPRGIYPKLLARISKHWVNFHGSDSAQITSPEDQGVGIHRGRILVWTDLDPNDPAIDKEKAEEVELADTDINVPPAFGIRYSCERRSGGTVFQYRKYNECSGVASS